MVLLRPHLNFETDETLLSFANRLSFKHTGRGMARLLTDLGIDVAAFISGRCDEVDKLATATGNEADCLKKNMISVYQRSVSFRGEHCSKTFISPRAAQYCPACLAEDGGENEWRHRLIWGIRHVHRCGEHGLWLAASENKMAVSLKGSLDPSTIYQHKIAANPEPEYLEWLTARILQIANDSEWLKAHTIEQVLNASEMLGAILEHGHKVCLTKLSPSTREDATDIGFSIFKEGPLAVEEALDTIRKTSPATAVQAGPLAHYGQLFDWLDRRCNAVDPGPIKGLLREHIVKNSAVEPGTTVLGVEITERRFHSVQSLSEQVGVDRKRLSRLLQKLGKIPAATTDAENGILVFDAAESLALIEAFQTAVLMEDVPEYLSGSKRQIETLYKNGFLKPLIPSTGNGSVRKIVFARKHLDDLLEMMRQFPHKSDALGANFQPISYACQHGAGAFDEVFQKVLGGKLACRRDPEKRGINQLLVDMSAT